MMQYTLQFHLKGKGPYRISSDNLAYLSIIAKDPSLCDTILINIDGDTERSSKSSSTAKGRTFKKGDPCRNN